MCGLTFFKFGRAQKNDRCRRPFLGPQSCQWPLQTPAPGRQHLNQKSEGFETKAAEKAKGWRDGVRPHIGSDLLVNSTSPKASDPANTGQVARSVRYWSAWHWSSRNYFLKILLFFLHRLVLSHGSPKAKGSWGMVFVIPQLKNLAFLPRKEAWQPEGTKGPQCLSSPRSGLRGGTERGRSNFLTLRIVKFVNSWMQKGADRAPEKY